MAKKKPQARRKGALNLTRKELRKQKRKEFKQRKNDYFMKKTKTPKTDMGKVAKNSKNDFKNYEVNSKELAIKEKSLNDEVDIEHEKEVTKRKKLEKEMKKARAKQLKEANDLEDRNIKVLEKNLGLDKRKGKNLPKSFSAMGLDYILEVCDSEKIQAAVNAERNLCDSESEFEDDLAVVTGGVSKKRKKPSQNSSDQASDNESSDSSPEEMSRKRPKDDFSAESDNGSDEIASQADTDSESVSSNNPATSDLEEEEENEEIKEDIYGRVKDKHGNILQEKYIPPHLRDKPLDDKKKQELDLLKKQLKGFLNRLAENNMHNISHQIDSLYMSHSRHDMNETMLNLYLESLVTSVHTPERLIMEHAMLIAILHANVGSEIGAFMLQHFVKNFFDLHPVSKDIENKKLDNLLLMICHMYTFKARKIQIVSLIFFFKIFDSLLLYEILDKFCENFDAKNVDLILVVLRSVGFYMRKANPLALKDFIMKVQTLANKATTLKDDSRVKFMLEVLLSIKNNNMSKLPQYDPEHSEHLKKIIKTMFRKGNYVTELKISLEDVLKAEERGRWWVVGSAWTGPAPQSQPKDELKGVTTFTEEILALAKKQRMNTANRKNIFCILMTAEDFLDAFEKLLRLGLKGQPEQEIIHVLIHCLLQEKSYNPYYSYIADQLCISDRRHRMTLQYSIWDKFKEMKSLAQNQITNFSRFVAHLIRQNSLPLSVLKVLEFADMDKSCVKLLRRIILTLLLDDDQDAILKIFTKIAKPTALGIFRQSLRLFIHHFVLKNMKESEHDVATKLKQRIALVDQALTAFSDKNA